MKFPSPSRPRATVSSGRLNALSPSSTAGAPPRRLRVRVPLASRRLRAGWSTLALAAATLCACDTGTRGLEPAVEAAGEDRFHEKSFSWVEPEATPALAKTATRRTRFASTEALGEAIRALNDSLSRRAFSDSLWKPVDHACDELDLALWNVYGTVLLRDSVVFDEAILKTRCTEIRGDQPLAKASAANATYPASEADHRVYPYKMIGRAWDNFDLVVYKSTGAETQFKKHREKLFVTAWWDTDASRIGVRAYLLNCGVNGTGTTGVRTCVSGGLRTASASNEDYVSQRDFSAGLGVTYTFPGTVTAAPTTLKVSDAVIGMHSVNHAGLAFRASTSSGLTSATVLTAVPPLEYVTW
jgi:hypothetical protein